MNANDMCKCGHTRAHHKFMGGISMCYAVVSMHPKRLCACKKFEEVTDEQKKILNLMPSRRG